MHQFADENMFWSSSCFSQANVRLQSGKQRPSGRSVSEIPLEKYPSIGFRFRWQNLVMWADLFCGKMMTFSYKQKAHDLKLKKGIECFWRGHKRVWDSWRYQYYFSALMNALQLVCMQESICMKEIQTNKQTKTEDKVTPPAETKPDDKHDYVKSDINQKLCSSQTNYRKIIFNLTYSWMCTQILVPGAKG